jgi:hypothetical protein
MDELINLGFSDMDLKSILEQCPNIMGISNEEVLGLIEILKYLGCEDRHIRNIIISNPYYLERNSVDVLKLIKYFKEINFSNLNLLFDSNPFLLNKDDFEIRGYVSDRLSMGMLLDDIIDEIDNNPYFIDEV